MRFAHSLIVLTEKSTSPCKILTLTFDYLTLACFTEQYVAHFETSSVDFCIIISQMSTIFLLCDQPFQHLKAIRSGLDVSPRQPLKMHFQWLRMPQITWPVNIGDQNSYILGSSQPHFTHSWGYTTFMGLWWQLGAFLPRQEAIK